MAINLISILQKFGYPSSLIHEYNNWYLLLRPKQVTLGSLILISKEKVNRYSDLSILSFTELQKIIKDVEENLMEIFNYSKINYLMLMMVDDIVHYHIIPRYENKRTFLNQEFIDSSWPNIPDLTVSNSISSNLFVDLVKEIQKKYNVQQDSQKKYNLIYTTGAFDMFHTGHLNILKKSKEICNYLLVGVSTDELILKEKKKEPVIPFKERCNIVKALRFVDEVIPQIDKDKQSIVNKFKIEAITVGNDWEGKYPTVSCDLIFLPYTKGISSTLLRDKVNND